jgi:RNA 2',3'-cyclic 3'-phosphodiesterase
VSGPTNARLFVAADPPAHVRDRLAGWARAALAHHTKEAHRARLRILEPELIHITICFLGSLPLADIGAIETALARCAGSVGALSLGGPVWLPERRPRALAVEVTDELLRLSRLRQEFSRSLLEDLGLRLRPGRFRPHATVARMPASGDPQKLGALEATPTARFEADSLTLYRSWLSGDGASYETLLRIEIDRACQDEPHSIIDEG